MKKCPKCAHNKSVKDGIINLKQRYRCKACDYRYTVNYRGKSPKMKRQALELYLEGLGFRSIARFLKCSHVAVYNWIKGFGEQIELVKVDSGVEVVEMDEMHTYIHSKKTTIGYGLLLIDMGKSSSTALLVTDQLKQGKGFGKQLTTLT